MFVKIDDEVLFEISETMVKLIGNDIVDPVNDIKRRLRYIIEHKCDRCYERLEKEWKEKLLKDPSVASFPKSREEFCKLVFSHPDYRSRDQIMAEMVKDQ